jgi:hypothetical protein
MPINKKPTQKSVLVNIKTLLIAIVLSFANASDLQAQAPADSINLELRRLFGGLSRPPSMLDFNYDMAGHFVDSFFFVPSNVTDTIDTDIWIKMYDEMTACAYDTTRLPWADKTLQESWQVQGDTVSMFIMNFKAYEFLDGSLDTNIYFDFDTLNNLITDKPGRPGWPYTELDIFAAAPNVTQMNSPSFVYRIQPKHIFTNQATPYDSAAVAAGWSLQMNFDDGSGWHTIIPGIVNNIPVTYTTVGVHRIATRLGENSVFRRFSMSRINILSIVQPMRPDDQFIAHDLDVGIYTACAGATPSTIKTIIYLEGIDILDGFGAIEGRRDVPTIYRDMIFNTGLADLRNFGYRFVVVNWMNSRIDMEQNALNVQNLINDLKCEAATNKNEEQFVIIGESMGGVIARLTLMKMEHMDVPAVDCYAQRTHNTRLLITIDAPHAGAHIPMSIQKLANFLRNSAGNPTGALFGTGPLGITSTITGNFFGALATKYLFDRHELFLQSTAAQQLLMDHVSTEVWWPTYAKYSEHRNRTDFLALMNKYGNNPRFVKIVAVANGNMDGNGQTQLWDGAIRTASDRILDMQGRLTIRIRKKNYDYAGFSMRLNTDPNGNGNLGYIQAGHWWFRFKVRLFKIKVITGFNSHTNKHWDAQMRPISTSSGGVYSYNEGLLDYIANRPNLNYAGAGNWTNPAGQQFLGSSSSISSDGFHWCFVPTASALGHGPFINEKYDSLGATYTMNRSPFAVCKGWPGDSVRAPGVNAVSTDFWRNAYLRNNFHTWVHNQVLWNNTTTPRTRLEYDITKCLSMNPQPNRGIFVLNREIGDDELYIENRILPWQGLYTAPRAVRVNVRNPFYRYIGLPHGINAIPSIYSKANPFMINMPNGMAYFNMMPSATFVYAPPMSGLWTKTVAAIEPCCEEMGRNIMQRIAPPAAFPVAETVSISIWPNPANAKINISCSELLAGSYLVDLHGRIFTLQPIQATTSTRGGNYECVLPQSLTNGLYTICTQLLNGTKNYQKIYINN